MRGHHRLTTGWTASADCSRIHALGCSSNAPKHRILEKPAPCSFGRTYACFGHLSRFAVVRESDVPIRIAADDDLPSGAFLIDASAWVSWENLGIMQLQKLEDRFKIGIVSAYNALLSKSRKTGGVSLYGNANGLSLVRRGQ